MLQVSQEAAAILEESRNTQGVPETFGVRVYGESTPQGGAAVHLAFVEDAEEGDQVTEQHGTRVFVAPEVAEPLSGAFLDVEKEEQETKLVLKGPGIDS